MTGKRRGEERRGGGGEEGRGEERRGGERRGERRGEERRGEERTDACELTLDINTTHPELKLSEDNRSVTKGDYPDRPQRFDVCPQLLCAQGHTGCHCG
ncbi:hypothetical protein ACEWY4_017338 [Coilia grayii]|uniref:SPRY-associated domain-containing protein n=1 Tax=Coilia grayii TaxID=363190 RepID=A0ABD1JGU3_9TELE